MEDEDPKNKDERMNVESNTEIDEKKEKNEKAEKNRDEEPHNKRKGSLKTSKNRTNQEVRFSDQDEIIGFKRHSTRRYDMFNAMKRNNYLGNGNDRMSTPAFVAFVGNACMVLLGVVFALVIRSLLFSFCIFTVWLVVVQLGVKYYWCLSLLSIFLLVETVQIMITRAGQERKWVCVCLVCFLVASVPSMWILQLERLGMLESKAWNVSITTTSSNINMTVFAKMYPDLTLSITEQSHLFIMILSRWLLPRGEITRNQLSQLLFVFIGMASDVMELFELFSEHEVRNDRHLIFWILFVWSLSLFQFCFVLTMARNPKKRRVALNEDLDPTPEDGVVDTLLKTELWSLILAIIMQDGPFLSVRLYSLVKYRLLNYSIIFFTCKNLLIILLLLYRLLILMIEWYEAKRQS